VPLHDVVNVLERFVGHIGRANERNKRQRQLDIIRAEASASAAPAQAAVG
jgi:hypothetical protein